MSALIAVIAVMLLQLSVWVPLGLAVLIVVSGILTLSLFWHRTGRLPAVAGNAVPLIAVFVIWCAISLIWAPDPGRAAGKLNSLAIMVVFGIAFILCARPFIASRLVALALIAGTLAAILSVGFEKFADAGIYRIFFSELPSATWQEFLNRYNRGMTVIALIAWPAAHAAARYHPVAGIALIVSALGLSAYMNSAAAIVALALGGVAYLLVWTLPRRHGPGLLGALAAAVILFMPVVVDQLPGKEDASAPRQTLPVSVYHRVLIWKFTNDRIAERPLLGWGFDASRTIPENTKQLDKGLAALPLHPHNAALQWRLELGLPGTLLAAMLVFVLFHGSRQLDKRSDRALVAAMLTGGVTIALLSYGIWQSWWVAALLMAAAFSPGASREGQ